jgi:hypothetical protein
MRRELDLLQKQRGVSGAQAPSGLKLHIPEPIRVVEQAATRPA